MGAAPVPWLGPGPRAAGKGPWYKCSTGRLVCVRKGHANAVSTIKHLCGNVFFFSLRPLYMITYAVATYMERAALDPSLWTTIRACVPRSGGG